MFLVRGYTSEAGISRVEAVRELYRSFFAQNTKEERGRRLLRDWLSPRQRAQFDDKGCFEVVGCDSEKRYRIYDRISDVPNIYEIDDAGRFEAAWCFFPAGRLAAGDIILAQKIALETNENSALAIAKRFTPRLDLILTTPRRERARTG
jgi:hypothetical protein